MPDGSSRDSLKLQQRRRLSLAAADPNPYNSRSVTVWEPLAGFADGVSINRAALLFGHNNDEDQIQKSLPHKADEGFTLIEVMIAIVVWRLDCSPSWLRCHRHLRDSIGRRDLIARQKVLEAMGHLHRAQRAADSVRGGGQCIDRRHFLDGPQALKCAGPDGLVGTADDVVCTTQAGANCPMVGRSAWCCLTGRHSRHRR
jgi:hypothetical protein